MEKPRVKSELQVFEIGTTVVLTSGTHAIILSVCISGEAHRIIYEVAYWSGGTRSETWIHQSEIKEVEGADDMRIGFQ